MNGTALSSGPGLGTVPTAWRIVATADFNGDGKSDILLWRNTTTGEVAVWFISGVTVTGTTGIGTVGLDWKIVGGGRLQRRHQGGPVVAAGRRRARRLAAQQRRSAKLGRLRHDRQ
jgi:hypothetical protein